MKIKLGSLIINSKNEHGRKIVDKGIKQDKYPQVQICVLWGLAQHKGR